MSSWIAGSSSTTRTVAAIRCPPRSLRIPRSYESNVTVPLQCQASSAAAWRAFWRQAAARLSSGPSSENDVAEAGGPIPTEIKLHRASRILEITFADGQVFQLPCEFLRVYSPSAEVRGHGPGQEVLQVGKREVGIDGDRAGRHLRGEAGVFRRPRHRAVHLELSARAGQEPRQPLAGLPGPSQAGRCQPRRRRPRRAPPAPARAWKKL